MAIRLGSHVRSGSIDNSERGRVTGQLSIEGLQEIVTLDLQGNAHPDMAGCVLEFRNPRAEPLDPEFAASLRTAQQGYAGDLSASQKRRVPRGFLDAAPDVDFGPSDSVLVNVLYLEWFDAVHGRVVIEGVGYEWEIDLPRWTITDEEIAEQKDQAEQAADLFMNLALEHYEALDEEIRAEEEEIDPDAGDEFTWEKRLRHSEDRVDALLALLDEAKTEEERKELLDRVFASRSGDGAAGPPEFEEPDSDEFREEEGRTRLDDDSRALVLALREKNDVLLESPAGGAGESPGSGELLTLAIKVRTATDMLLEDEGAFEPGFVIALLKREIARCHAVAGYLKEEAPAGERPLLDTVWRIRDLLVEVAGRLRSGEGRQ